jgi:hypothetical protein
MKKLLVIKTIVIALCLSAITNRAAAQNDADPAITSMSFAASPIRVDNTTTLTVTFVNNGFTTAIASGSVGLNISLPTSQEYVAEPQSVLALSGSFKNRFNWTFNTSTRTFIGVSNSSIGAGEGGTIVVNVKGAIEVAARISVANIIRYLPVNYPNENINNNNLTASLGVIPRIIQPVLLLDFNAVKQNTTAQLSWKTSSETNSSYFEVLWSKDGVNFTNLGNVSAAGNSSTTRYYSFNHPKPQTGVNFYRLREVDLNGNYMYSDIKAVSFGKNTEIIIKPNPVVDNLYIYAGSSATTFKGIDLYSSDGKHLQHLDKLNSGESVHMNQYPAGTYMLRITDSNGTAETHLIMKGKL